MAWATIAGDMRDREAHGVGRAEQMNLCFGVLYSVIKLSIADYNKGSVVLKGSRRVAMQGPHVID